MKQRSWEAFFARFIQFEGLISQNEKGNLKGQLARPIRCLNTILNGEFFLIY